MNLVEYMRAARLTPEKDDKIEYMTMHDKMVSNVLVNAQRNTAPVSCIYNADVTKLMDAFYHLKSKCDYRLTLNTLMIKVLVEGLKSAPRLNAHYEYNHNAETGRLVIKNHIDVSMAICTDEGSTYQMKLQHLEDKSLKEIAAISESAQKRFESAELDDVMFEVSRQRIIGELSHGRIASPLAQSLGACFGKGRVVNLARSLKSDFLKIIGKKELQPETDVKMEELNEGTVCFTNWGTLYDKLNVDIVRIPLLYPQVFLFATGRLRDESFAYEDENGAVRLGKKKILPLGFNFDHKIGGANDLMPFIRKLDEIFENPQIIYSW